MGNVQIFPLEIGHFEDDHRFLFSREMWNIRSCEEVRGQKLIKFIQVVRIVFVLTFLKLRKNEKSFEESLPFPGLVF